MSIIDAIAEGIMRGYNARQLPIYLAMVNPHPPGSYADRVWSRQRRRLAGRLRRRREPARQLVGQLPLGWTTP
jgi:hypothetical protein